MDLFGGGGGSGPIVPSQRFGGQPWISCFFAVLPPPAVAQSVHAVGRELRRSIGLRGKLIGPDRYHITLCGTGAFGEVPFEAVELLKQIGASIQDPVFDVFFDLTAAFSGSYGKRSLVLTASDTLPALVALQTRLYDAMQAADLPVDERFNPHITLLYDKRPAPRIEIPRLSFTVPEFVLIRSVHGTSRHDHLARWQLGSR
ncbi:2'-5' RNA ligase family protein [Boseaceae bacterium BT-24-1]|nr:2'-5' RNA ligase family protein [Boseaceae bacterium BT-24-1]